MDKYYVLILAFLAFSSLNIIYTYGMYERLKRKGLRVELDSGSLAVNSYMIGAVGSLAVSVIFNIYNWLF